CRCAVAPMPASAVTVVRGSGDGRGTRDDTRTPGGPPPDDGRTAQRRRETAERAAGATQPRRAAGDTRTTREERGTMAIIARNTGSGDFEPAPAGAHQAVCVDVVDKGVVKTEWQ